MKTYTIIPLHSGFNLEHEGNLTAITGTQSSVIDAVKAKIGTYLAGVLVAGDSTPITIEIKVKK